MDTKTKIDTTESTSTREMANAIRALSMDAVQKANSGHPGMPMGMADVASVLFSKFLKFDPENPDWPDRDRFILSAGHGSMLLYSLLYLCGYDDMSIDELRNFRQFGSRTAGHPEYGYCGGIEMTTGPLGQGVATSVGMAFAEKKLAQEFGHQIVDHYTYVIAGDGCLMEGISHEAIDLAGHLKLSKLILLFDDNGISIDGSTNLSTSTDQLARFSAAGWDVAYIDGHDPLAIEEAISRARLSDQPSLIACKTIIGFGAPGKQGTAATHGAPLGDDEIAAARQQLGWDSAPFQIPENILNRWRECSSFGRSERQQWLGRVEAMPSARKQLFDSMLNGELGNSLDSVINELKAGFSEQQPTLATRQSSQKVLESLMQAIPWLLSGSADLSGSNGTRPANAVSIQPDDFGGNYLHYGVREHGMAAAMNGIALHGGYIPLSGTFLVFADYSRPAIRLGALMKQRVIHVMSHDSIGLGEDGPTHQPVEHLASLRAIPNLLVFRPADAVEVAECWQAAITDSHTPSVMCLSRQGLPTLRTDHREENLCARGAYLIRQAKGKRRATLMATGSEVSIAIEAAEKLAQFGTEVAVVSVPCWELFQQQSPEYQKTVLGNKYRVAIEAASSMGWERWIGDKGRFIGMPGFGASAPAEALYQHFGITADAIQNEVRSLLHI